MPKIPNIIQINKTTTRTLRIPPTDSKSAVTTVFIFLLCEINRRGRNVLNSLRILTNPRSTDNRESIREALTIKKSS